MDFINNTTEDERINRQIAKEKIYKKRNSEKPRLDL